MKITAEARLDALAKELFSVRLWMRLLKQEARHLAVFGCACMAVCMAAYHFLNVGTVQTTMSLNYEQSTKGKTPNDTRFNGAEFLSQDYLEAIIEAAGLQDMLSTDELYEMLSIKPYNRRSSGSDGEEYDINSSYTITLELPWRITRVVSAQDMLSVITSVFQEKYTLNHRVTAKALEIETDYSEMDYSQISSYFSMMDTRISNYLDIRNESAGSYISDDELTYKSIKKLLSNIESYDLKEFDSYIWENGIAKDTATQINELVESNRLLNWDYQEKDQKNTTYMEVLEMYKNKMTSSVLIPTYDAEGAFYMSRTKTGLDELATTADSLLTDASAINEKIITNLDKIQKLSSVEGNDKSATAEAMVTKISAALSDIVSSIQRLDDSYYQEKVGDYLIFREGTSSLNDRLGVTKSFLVSAVICILYLTWRAVSDYRAEQRRRMWIELLRSERSSH